MFWILFHINEFLCNDWKYNFLNGWLSNLCIGNLYILDSKDPISLRFADYRIFLNVCCGKEWESYPFTYVSVWSIVSKLNDTFFLRHSIGEISWCMYIGWSSSSVCHREKAFIFQQKNFSFLNRVTTS